MFEHLLNLGGFKEFRGEKRTRKRTSRSFLVSGACARGSASPVKANRSSPSSRSASSVLVSLIRLSQSQTHSNCSALTLNEIRQRGSQKEIRSKQQIILFEKIIAAKRRRRRGGERERRKTKKQTEETQAEDFVWRTCWLTWGEDWVHDEHLCIIKKMRLEFLRKHQEASYYYYNTREGPELLESSWSSAMMSLLEIWTRQKSKFGHFSIQASMERFRGVVFGRSRCKSKELSHIIAQYKIRSNFSFPSNVWMKEYVHCSWNKNFRIALLIKHVGVITKVVANMILRFMFECCADLVSVWGKQPLQAVTFLLCSKLWITPF